MSAFVRAIGGTLRELAGLFFDDGSLAITVLLVLAATALYASTPWFDAAVAMAFLVAAVVAALLENVVRTARAGRPVDRTLFPRKEIP
jgi:hypothetical protein